MIFEQCYKLGSPSLRNIPVRPISPSLLHTLTTPVGILRTTYSPPCGLTLNIKVDMGTNMAVITYNDAFQGLLNVMSTLYLKIN